MIITSSPLSTQSSSLSPSSWQREFFNGASICYSEVKVDLVSSELDDEFVKKYWREIGMNTHSAADVVDDELLYDAAWEFYNEKYSEIGEKNILIA